MLLNFWLNGKEYSLYLQPKTKETLLILNEGKTYEVSAEFITEEEIVLQINSRVYNVYVQSDSVNHNVIMGDKSYQVEKRTLSLFGREQKTGGKRKEVRITMPGKVVALHVENGTEVKEGQPILILEAMKMQNEIKAPKDGRIANLKVKPGETVEAGAILFTLE